MPCAGAAAREDTIHIDIAASIDDLHRLIDRTGVHQAQYGSEDLIAGDLTLRGNVV